MQTRKERHRGFWQTSAAVLGLLVVTYFVFGGPWGCSPEDSSWETARASSEATQVAPEETPEGAAASPEQAPAPPRQALATIEPAAGAADQAAADRAAAAGALAEIDATPAELRVIVPGPAPTPSAEVTSSSPSVAGRTLVGPKEERAPLQNSDPREAAIAAAAAAWEQQDPLTALDQLEPWLAEDLGATGHFIAGSAHLALEEPAAARDHLERAALADPSRPAVWSALARAHLKAASPRLAYRAAHRALRLDRQDDQAWLALGLALLDLQRSDEALGAFESATAIDPQNAEAWNGIGLIWLLRDDFAPARAALEKAVALPDAPAHAHNNLGLVYERLGFAEWADREYARCLELAPEHPTAALSRQRIAPFLAIRARH